MVQITVKQLATAKRTAANVLPLTTKKAKLYAKIAEMQAEIEELNKQIDAQQTYIKSISNGLTTEQLIIRDQETRAFKPNPDVLKFDEDRRVYVVIEEAQAGSDFDVDKAVAEVVTPSAEEIAAAEEAQHEAQAEEEERQQEAEAARIAAEQQAAEEARQAEIAAAKERLSQAKPQEEVNDDPFAPID